MKYKCFSLEFLKKTLQDLYNVYESMEHNLAWSIDMRKVANFVFGIYFRCCPYFIARELKNNADIIFMPYNYLLDSKARKRHGIELTNSVVIFDEAHNISSVCENSASVQIKSQDLASAISEVVIINFFIEKKMIDS